MVCNGRMQSPVLAIEISTGRKSLIKFFQPVINGKNRRMKPKQTMFRYRTTIMHPFSGCPLFCAKNFKKTLFWAGFGRFLFENDPAPYHRLGIPPATTGSWRPASLAGSYAHVLVLQK